MIVLARLQCIWIPGFETIWTLFQQLVYHICDLLTLLYMSVQNMNFHADFTRAPALEIKYKQYKALQNDLTISLI